MQTKIQMSDILAAWEMLKEEKRDGAVYSLEVDLRFNYSGNGEEKMTFRAYTDLPKPTWSGETNHPLDAVHMLRERLIPKDIWGDF